MSTIVAIGGGKLKYLETLPIDREIVKLSKKKHPKVLFIPTASNDALGYWSNFNDIYRKKLGCTADVLFLIREKLSKKQIEEKILSADIIYVGGGNTLRMLRIWKNLGVDEILLKAYKKGIILSGLSAGAICWFRYGLSDSRCFMKNGKEINSLMRVSGLGFLSFSVSPHHIREKKLRNAGIKEMMKRTPGIALAIDDNAAIIVRDSQYRILKSKKDAKVTKVFKRKDKIVLSGIKYSGSLQELYAKL